MSRPALVRRIRNKDRDDAWMEMGLWASRAVLVVVLTLVIVLLVKRGMGT